MDRNKQEYMKYNIYMNGVQVEKTIENITIALRALIEQNQKEIYNTDQYIANQIKIAYLQKILEEEKNKIKMQFPSVIFSSDLKESIEKLFLSYLDKGYFLEAAYTKRRFILFGKKKYYIKMKGGLEFYEMSIASAIRSENYEEAKRLTLELNSLKMKTPNF
jgi:hypothetical protein